MTRKSYVTHTDALTLQNQPYPGSPRLRKTCEKEPETLTPCFKERIQSHAAALSDRSVPAEGIQGLVETDAQGPESDGSRGPESPPGTSGVTAG